MADHKRYMKFVDLVKQAYPDVSKKEAYTKAQQLWNGCKADADQYQETTNTLKARVAKLKAASITFWMKSANSQDQEATGSATTSSPGPSPSPSPAADEPGEEVPPAIVSSDEDGNEGTPDEPPTKTAKIQETPAQDKKVAEINNLQSAISSLVALRNSGMSTVTLGQISDKQKELKLKKQQLNKLKSDAKRKQTRRSKFRDAVRTVCEDNPAIGLVLNSFNRGITGRPRLEAETPDLLAAIINIVQSSSTADDRRRTECLRTVTTLDDLTAELNKLGYKLSRSAAYLRLMPRRGNTSEGKRHVQTVPVKLLRPESSLRKKNLDRMYAASFINDMFEVAHLFGPQAVLFLSNDDKARVPLGLAAASLQAPLLMHLEYRVRLPDHDFVVGQRHKLIPSVYGVCEINRKGEVTYSGDTFIRIRSGKHDKSSANTHSYDMHQLFQTQKVPRKPILLIETDGAADEAPRFPTTMASAVSLFKELELDAFLHGVNAAGLSAFNPVERRMAPLSHDLAGIVLPHDHYGNHLDSQQKTTDVELEKENFFKAAEVLADVWSKTVIDGHKVDCQPLRAGCEIEPEAVDPEWAATHVQQSRYSLQVVKCFNTDCCPEFATNWAHVFPSRFIPLPAVYEYSSAGMTAVEPRIVFAKPKEHIYAPLKERLIQQLLPREANKYDVAPFDLYCPSMVDKLRKGICPQCKSYWPSQAAMLRHAKCHPKQPSRSNQVQVQAHEVIPDDSDSDDSDVEVTGTVTVVGEDEIDDIMPVRNIFELLQSPFVEENEDVVVVRGDLPGAVRCDAMPGAM